jgi:hypothetical protein
MRPRWTSLVGLVAMMAAGCGKTTAPGPQATPTPTAADKATMPDAHIGDEPNGKLIRPAMKDLVEVGRLGDEPAVVSCNALWVDPNRRLWVDAAAPTMDYAAWREMMRKIGPNIIVKLDGMVHVSRQGSGFEVTLRPGQRWKPEPLPADREWRKVVAIREAAD